MNDFELPDEDEQALMKKPRPVGWFAAGAVAIFSVGFVFAFYLPLSSAHDTLLENHEKLAKKSHELDHALKTKSEALASTEERRASLERFVTQAGDQEKSLASKLEIANATAENGLKAYTKAKLVTSEVTDRGVELSVSEKLLFRPGSSATGPQAKAPLCAAGQMLKQGDDWVIRVKVSAAEDDKKYWETTGERAAALAELLESSCGVGADKILVTATRPGGEAKEGSNVHILVGPKDPPRVKGSDAPLDKPEEKN